MRQGESGPRICVAWLKGHETLGIRWLFAASGVVGAVGLFLVADRGGELVYRWGVGVVVS